MLFHYTTRFDQLYIHTNPPLVSVPWGHLGVNLFFMISGFVIFMTLDKTKHPMDFVVSRLSRLYPAYWAAILLTFGITTLLQLPGKEYSIGTVLANMLMFHALLHVPHVDGVYWTLEVELLFYVSMLAMWSVGLLRRMHAVMLGWLMARLAYLAASTWLGIDLPYLVSRMLILQYIPYFVLGIVAYSAYRSSNGASRSDAAVAFVAFAAIVAGDGIQRGLVSALLYGLLLVALFRPFGLLRSRALVWLGAISYPLYLLHENIGWSLLLALETRGVSPWAAIIVSIGCALLLSHGLHRAIEIPAMNAIRARYRSSSRIPVYAWRPWRWAGACALSLVALTTASFLLRSGQTATAAGLGNMKNIQALARGASSCDSSVDDDTIVLLVLGQSNAGNHGEPSQAPLEAKVFYEGRCYISAEPLPGATGVQGSVWPAVGQRLSSQLGGRSILFAIVAVDASEIAAWSTESGLQARVRGVVDSLKARQLEPDAVLWQQGEMDAQLGTSAEDYVSRFSAFSRSLRSMGVTAPLLVARSTYCRGDSYGTIRRAQELIIRTEPGVLPGPDTDELREGYRVDGCHFSQSGLNAAAEAWAADLVSVLAEERQRMRSDPSRPGPS